MKLNSTILNLSAIIINVSIQIVEKDNLLLIVFSVTQSVYFSLPSTNRTDGISNLNSEESTTFSAQVSYDTQKTAPLTSIQKPAGRYIYNGNISK